MATFGTQLKSLAALPGQIIKSGLAAGQAYDMRKKLQVRQNQKNPMYGAKKFKSVTTMVKKKMSGK